MTNNKTKNETGKAKRLFQFKNEIDKWRFLTLIGFILIVIALAWQSDDAYHGYVMSRNLAEGHGLVYNVGERSTASTCPLFTLIIAAAYFITREMFFTSLLVCTLFSGLAYYILVYRLCKTKEQVLISFAALVASQSFISYTTSGLENSLLFFLSALFLWQYSLRERFDARNMLRLALIFSCMAMARMDSVLLYIPVIVWIYLFRRDKVSFPKAVGIGFLGLLPFIVWELFSLFYFGFPFPNPYYVKLGTGIGLIEYIKRGILYFWYTGLNDAIVISVPLAVSAIAIILKKPKYILVASGILLYFIYIIRIGGDFMMGRHFTNPFFMSICLFMILQNHETNDFARLRKYRTLFNGIVIVSIVFVATFGRTIGSQYLTGHLFSSQISDEREYYFETTGLYNNIVSLVKEGRLAIPDTWNNEAPNDLRKEGFSGGIIDNAAGILVYYNPDLYLNDTYALGDPFLSKLPATYNPNWRVGHLKREVPHGYRASIWFDKNDVKDPDLHEYYEAIRLITRGDLFDGRRIQAILDVNLGKYDGHIDRYMVRLAEEHAAKDAEKK
ncbi:MAG: hypothetical protein K5989_10920 [Lachnospiraceae bacterium]|nr:hypothetical protein [Lachnospiraceae bacterium]